MEPRKNPSVDIDKRRPFYFAVGITVSLSFMLVAFEWKSFKEVVLDQFFEVQMDEVVEEIAPIIIPQNTPPPPVAPPPPVIEELKIVEDDVEVEDIEVDVQAPEEISAPVVTTTQVEENVSDEVFLVVEDMPRFKGCENLKSNEEADACFQREITKFLSKNIQYPQRAKDATVEGMVYVSFVVDQTGKVTDVKLLRGIGFGCDEEAIRVVKMLPQFVPGKQRGRPAKVGYNLPISFKLR